jgi:hypothetical protein
MKPTLYAELPIDKIKYLKRPEFFEKGTEHQFYHDLKNSMSKHGMRDPIFAYEYADGTIKTIVGNNRMVIANKLGIKIIRCIITQMKSTTSSLKGKILKTDQEILKLFYLPEFVDIRRHPKEGWIDQVTPQHYKRNIEKYV